MIPKVIQIINDAKEEKVINTITSLSQCNKCITKINDSSTYVVLTDEEIVYTVCDNCANSNMLFKGKVLFKDSWTNYQKRLKNGWIKQLIKEANDAKNKKGS